MDFLLWLVSAACFLYVVISAWRSHAPSGTKWIWTILAVIPGFNIVTAIAYKFLGPESERA